VSVSKRSCLIELIEFVFYSRPAATRQKETDFGEAINEMGVVQPKYKKKYVINGRILASFHASH